MSWYLKADDNFTTFNSCTICTLLYCDHWRHFWKVETDRSLLFTVHVHLVSRFRTHYVVTALCVAYVLWEF
jgi:hypothetical protein